MKVSATFLVSLLFLSACGSGASDGDTPANGGTTQLGTGGTTVASSGFGGNASSTGGSQFGGTSSQAPSQSGVVPSAGGKSGSGGSASSATTVAPGQPCSAVCATGEADICLGEGCPYGQCGAPWHGHECSFYYSQEVGATTTYCSAGQTGNYCLTTQPAKPLYWAVNCSNGTPTITSCLSGCQADPDAVASCTQY